MVRQRFFPPDGYVPKAHGYVLVDLDMQWDRDGVIADQVELLGEYWRRFGHSIERVIAEPPGDKAYRSDFRFRPGGAEVMRLLQPGDHLVIDSLEQV